MELCKTVESLHIAITGMNAKPENPGPGLAVAKCIRHSPQFGGRIIGLGYDVLDPGMYLEEDIDSAYLLPYPSMGERSLLERLREIHEIERIDVLIPCLDAELLSMINLQDDLSAMGIKMLLPSKQQLQERDKDRLQELSENSGVDIPEYTKVTNTGFFYNCQQKGWRYPVVVKSVFYDAGIAHNADEAAFLFHKLAAEWGLPILVQRYIEGDEVNLTGIGDGKGGLLGPVMMRKRAVTDKGKAWAGITVHDKALLDAATALVKALKWIGPLEVEMMRDENGDYHLIEINPRFPAWIYLSCGVGCNLPWALVRLIMGEDCGDLPAPEAGTLFIRYAQDVIVKLPVMESVTMYGYRANTKVALTDE